MITVYTDGGARPTNPGPAGWAYLAIYPNGEERTKSWHDPHNTNNAMELTAAFNALIDLQFNDLLIISDSIYLVNGMNEWIERWVKDGWRTRERRPIKNVDLWRALWSLKHEYVDANKKLVFKHVKGHSGDKYNDIVDTMATEMALFAAR